MYTEGMESLVNNTKTVKYLELETNHNRLVNAEMMVDIEEEEEIQRYGRIRMATLDDIRTRELYHSKVQQRIYSRRKQKSSESWKQNNIIAQGHKKTSLKEERAWKNYMDTQYDHDRTKYHQINEKLKGAIKKGRKQRQHIRFFYYGT